MFRSTKSQSTFLPARKENIDLKKMVVLFGHMYECGNCGKIFLHHAVICPKCNTRFTSYGLFDHQDTGKLEQQRSALTSDYGQQLQFAGWASRRPATSQESRILWRWEISQPPFK